VQRFQVDRRGGGLRLLTSEHANGPVQELVLPRRDLIWFGCMSYCCANCDSVFSPFTAANATFALNAGECVRRIRLVIECS